MAPRLKILISSGSKEGNRYNFLFSENVPVSDSPPSYLRGAEWHGEDILGGGGGGGGS
jgi:hypothetical protein